MPSKDKSTASDDTATSTATEAAPAAQLSIHQWCQVTGKHPHRTQAFVRSQPANDINAMKTADQWTAAYDAFMQTPVK